MMIQFRLILKMNEIDQTKLTEQTKFQLAKITEIQNYFLQEINQRKLWSKNLNKYVAAFDHIDKILIVSSAISGGVCIISFASVVGAPIGIAGASFTLIFFSNNRNSQKITKHKKKQKEKA